MTDKELRKLKRTELLEILFYLRKEIDELRAENDSLKEKLATAGAGGMTEESRNDFLASVRQVVEDCLKGKAPPGSKSARKGKGKKGRK